MVWGLCKGEKEAASRGGGCVRVMILDSFAFGHTCLRLLGRVISESDMG